ncbi:DUF1398 domain-containing protein [Azospirillum brasilense]|uniref:DUF1398 domain-containing protein n=1 Tax=Azospirillum brasilense TaxID=192 RepID=UPI000E6A443A|nr:DUF1398 family protein [Azospirillum brasilense]NUB24181.1 DUF1398 domain-containing protein [Azospirillum brasilense]NUB30471.1 DUF1398 domain-containing protein [Azospirillum brasilense]RIW04228.1 DUF1398 domain-containing protein [Azospirillum brasilense]
MDSKITAILQECSRASDEERITFPEVVAALAVAGVERYHTDLVRAETTYYFPDGTTERVGTRPAALPPATDFSAESVESAVRAIQAGTIRYGGFCERVLRAGCAGWTVSILGRRVVYYGRSGDSHTEWFPGAR